MSSAHFIYIPLVAIAGMMLGFIIGGRAARNAYELELRREQERAEARARRAARKARRQQEAGSPTTKQGADTSDAANGRASSPD
ncbi:MAG: hypothetical protein MJE77_34815 [Proteobacteria bacterium]|nr:hypothetical protein [Pseudomonadota bacterium]